MLHVQCCFQSVLLTNAVVIITVIIIIIVFGFFAMLQKGYEVN